jgi:hypothetical protein
MRAVLKLIGMIAAILAMSGEAMAQGSVQQAGPIVPYHPPAFYANGVIGDGGNNTSPFLSATALFGGTSCPLSVSSQTGPGVSVAQYGLLTVCQTNTATTFTVIGVNGLATPGVFFNIGGVTYPFPGAGGGNVVGPMSSTSGHLAAFNGTSGALLQDSGVSMTAPSFSGKVTTAVGLVTTAMTFAALDASPTTGERAYITDDNSACTFLTIATGGGTTKCPLVYDGTNWVAG